MKILVTGSAGFIGGHLVDYLIKKNYSVIGIDDLSGGFKKNVNPKSIFIKLDLRKKNLTISTLNKFKPDLIYHLAADATEGRSQFTPVSCSERNYLATLNLLVAAVKAKTRKIVLTSSMSVYGKQQPPFNEYLLPKPVDIYGISKTAMEQATKVFSEVYGLSYTILRPHNVYGPRQNMADPYRNVIAIFINRILNDQPPIIYGDGEQKRSFSYIGDIIKPFANAGLWKKTNGEIINLGPRKEYTINQIAAEVISHFKTSAKNPQSLQPIHTQDRPQEVKNAYCTDKKAKKLLDFKHSTTLKSGISKTVAWAKSLGPQRFKYLSKLEIENHETPKTWKDKLL
jgi:UDP-glucose 4-epimerase